MSRSLWIAIVFLFYTPNHFIGTCKLFMRKLIALKLSDYLTNEMFKYHS